MIIKYKSKFILLIIISFTILLFIPFFLFQTVQAGGCEDGRYNANPGGVDPVTSPNSPSNCSSLTLMNNVLATTIINRQRNICSDSRVTYSFCGTNQNLVATASGDLYLYHRPSSGIEYFFRNTSNGQEQQRAGTDPSPINMSRSIIAGQTYIIKPTGSDWNLSLGWRRVAPNTTNAFVLGARADAAAKGYTIIAEMVWADSSTCASTSDPLRGCSLYDSYDFDDTTIILAVHNPEPVPTCNNHPVSLSVSAINGSTLYHGEQANFNASVAIPNSGGFRYEFINNQFTVGGSPAPNFRISQNGSPTYLGECIPQAGVNSTISTICYINNRNSTNSSIDFTSTTRWVHTYRVCNNSGCSANCTAQSNTFTIYPYPGFIKTSQNGTAYTRGAITQARFPDSGHSFTSRLFLSATANNQFVPANKLVPNNTNSIYGYVDNNKNDTNYYNSLKTKLTSDLRLNKIEHTGPQTIDDAYLTQIANTSGTNPVNLLYFTSSITITGTNNDPVYCRKPTIFLVNGDINFNRQFRLQPNSNSACLFIASGSVNFNTTGNDDRFDGFFIANNIQTSLVGKITIKGGVVGLNANFNKNINANKISAVDIHPPKKLFTRGQDTLKFWVSI